ncbi:unnamed protein product [Durusdinium trenchii]|uniref:C3H1-type domain-containing protein n=1 Tax=Durusdinium trenchii TaxID=1381693 RepID=A0ABP0PIM3_9DINO
MADAQEREQVFELVVKQTFLEFVPSEPRTSLGLAARSHSAPPPPRSSEATEDVEDDSNQSASSYQAEKAEDTDHEGEHSIGSTSHRVGLCKPCAWYWKPGGCMNGAQCRHCHLCPHGELGRRKRMNRKIARNTRQAQADDPAPAQSLQSDSETAEPEPEMEVTSSEVDATPLSLFHAVPVHDGSPLGAEGVRLRNPRGAGHAAVDAPAADVAAGLWSGPDVEHHAELRTTELCAKGL